MDIIHKLKIMSQDEKIYTLEEAKAHGKKFIAEQAEILRKNLKEKRSDKNYVHV